MTSPTVSIIIVSYRSAQFTIDCLRSVEQERSALELRIRAVVVDNASGDIPVISRAVADCGWDSWVDLLEAPRNGGFSYGNNLGIRLALEQNNSDYVLVLNPDTQVRPGAIAVLVQFLEARLDVGIAGGSFEYPDGTEWPIAFRFPTLISELCSAVSLGIVSRLCRRWAVAREMPPIAQQVDWICGASMMIRRQVLETIGGFDENFFLYFEETDLCLRARRAGFSTWYIPASRVMHICGQSTGVTARNSRPKRLPPYWFESRRRYFAMAFGIGHAMLIDLLVLVAYPIGWSKRLILQRTDESIPHFWRDLLRGSVLRPRNCRFPPLRATAVELISGSQCS